MENRSMFQWLDEVIKQLHFIPDRKTVRQELLDHLLDRRGDFLEQGLPLDEAEAAAVAAMGDPTQIGRLLNRVHSPWLGWLCVAAKWIAAVLAVVLSLQLLQNGGVTEAWREDIRIVLGREPTCQQELWFRSHDPDFSENRVPLETGLSFREGDYRFTVKHGFYYEEPWLEDAPIQHFSVCLRVEAEHFWQERPAVLEERLQAVDNLGCIYTMEDPFALQCRVTDAGLPVWEVNLQQTIFVEDGQPRQWVRFTVPGTGFSLTLRTNGEVRQ